MYKFIGLASFLLCLFIISLIFPQPSFNAATPGCSGNQCHNQNPGMVSVTPQNNLQVEVLLNGVPQGENVAGELVNSSGEVVDVKESSPDNPFILTAPATGTYLVNGGTKKPNRLWDSASVNLNVTEISTDLQSQFPAQMELLGNHPNPFNNETVISFSLPEQSSIELHIYNINGRIIRNLINGDFQSGHHTVRWDGKNDSGQIVASGIYIYQLISGEKQLTKRLVFAK